MAPTIIISFVSSLETGRPFPEPPFFPKLLGGAGKNKKSNNCWIKRLRMEAERIFSAEQIVVHPDLAKIIREYSKAVIKAAPEDIIEFSWLYFQKKVEEDEAAKKDMIASDVGAFEA